MTAQQPSEEAGSPGLNFDPGLDPDLDLGTFAAAVARKAHRSPETL